MRMIVSAIVLAVLVIIPAEASVPPPTIKIAVAGDSISAPCHTVSEWCGELHTTLATQGIHAEFRTLAEGGRDCVWVAERIAPFLAQHDPDILLLNCGTNDDTNRYCYGEPCTAWAWRVIVEAARSTGVHVGVAFIGYTDPDDYRVLGHRPRLERVNDILYSQIVQYVGPWDLALANFQVVPGNVEYLPDGVHPIGPLGARTYAQIWHAAVAQKAWGWPPAGTAPCGMYGRRAGYPVPSYAPCPK